ncbi:MAG: tetratricopeptide repeat protein [Planctomycetota bacterium]
MAHLKKRKRRPSRVARAVPAPTGELVSEVERTVAEAMQAAVRLHQSGHYAEAAQLYSQVLSTVPEHADAWHLSGVLAHQQRDYSMAADLIRHAIELRGENAEFHLNYGAAIFALGQVDDAIASFERSIQIEPSCLAWNNLGNAHKSIGEHQTAVEAYEIAIGLDANDVRPLANLGAALLEKGDLLEAESTLESASKLAPDYVEIQSNLALTRTRLGKFEQATELFVSVLTQQPELSAAWRNLRNCLNDSGTVSRSRSAYSKVVAESDRVLLDVLSISTCPVVNESAETIDEYRGELGAVASRYNGASLLDRHRDLQTHQILAPFYLPYQGLDDRPLKEAYARMIESDRVRPLHKSVTPVSEKLRIGFPVALDRHHIFLRFMRGLLETLAASTEFEIVVACMPQNLGTLKSSLPEDTRFIPLAEDLLESAQRLAESRCHALYHYEIGTDTLNYFLPFFGAAPTQVTSWGIPVTSGIPAVDYFLSSELIEPTGADDHYSETLIQLRSLPVLYERPVVRPQVHRREDFGFHVDDHLYGCLQSPFKNHPDFDLLIGNILREDQAARIILVGGAHETSNELLRRRMANSIGDLVSRVRFMPRMNSSKFIDLMRCCDVLLDTIHFGGGATTYEAMSLGIPIVTLPGQFMRGRITAGCYRKIEIDDCVALNPEDYVQRAVMLATDSDRNHNLRERILEKADLIFEDAEAGYEIQEFFHSVVSNDSPRAAS